MRNLMSILRLNRAKKGRLNNMKVYLVPTKQGYIQRKGIFKPNEIVPFLQSVIKRQAVILANIKKAGCR